MRERGYVPGDWLADCYRCSRTQLASKMRKQWQGYYVCASHWEERHPQDFVKASRDEQRVPWAQPPPEDTFVAFCTLNGQSAIPGYSMPDCMIPGREHIDHDIDPVAEPPVCDIYGVQGVPGWGMPGCSTPGFDPFVATAGGPNY